jgi:hypothetical protein
LRPCRLKDCYSECDWNEEKCYKRCDSEFLSDSYVDEYLALLGMKKKIETLSDVGIRGKPHGKNQIDYMLEWFKKHNK